VPKGSLGLVQGKNQKRKTYPFFIHLKIKIKKRRIILILVNYRTLCQRALWDLSKGKIKKGKYILFYKLKN
jgi:hypothetical protein